MLSYLEQKFGKEDIDALGNGGGISKKEEVGNLNLL